jgi:hypothetical protein
MAMKRLLIPALAAAVALGLFGCSSPPKSPAAAPVSESTASPESTSAAEVPVTDPAPTVESLKDASISQMQEGLVFDYLRAGGFAALESRFGKPTMSYKTAADESSNGSTLLADGRVYLVQCGLAANGTPLVMAHSVEAVEGQTQTAADTAFLKAIVDGTTTMAAANAYLARVGGTVQAAVMDPKGLNVPAHVWQLKDGNGFIVVDLTALTPAQMAAIGLEDSGPFQALYWDAQRWRVGP